MNIFLKIKELIHSIFGKKSVYYINGSETLPPPLDIEEEERMISNIKYDCVYYNAITTNGNSGGMIINYDYKLIGVITFGLNDEKGDYLYGAGSPVSKVKEFLNNNSFEVGDNDD